MAKPQECKPLSAYVKSCLKQGTKTVWLDCPLCDCSFEVTERKAKESPGMVCYECFIKRIGDG